MAGGIGSAELVIAMGKAGLMGFYGAGGLPLPAVEAGVNFIRLTTPTTDETRMPAVLQNTSGFIYYVSILGITGTKSAPEDAIRDAVARFRKHTELPIAVGFGIKTPEQARTVAGIADAAVVGSAIVDKVLENLEADGKPKAGLADAVLGYVSELAKGVRG